MWKTCDHDEKNRQYAMQDEKYTRKLRSVNFWKTERAD
jgi:hypothetical protein